MSFPERSNRTKLSLDQSDLNGPTAKITTAPTDCLSASFDDQAIVRLVGALLLENSTTSGRANAAAT